MSVDVAVGVHTIDTVGIGFGPSAIAIAAALADGEEEGAGTADVRFLERADSTAWHPGMLLPDAAIQHHYLRDLATPRNPRSRFTFPNYLKEHDRIHAFGELAYGAADGAVSRREWSDYIAWVAGLLGKWVRYGQEVLAVRASLEQRTLIGFVVETPTRTFNCRNVIVSSGRAPALPRVLDSGLGSLVVHSSHYIPWVESSRAASVRRVAVVGSGQSAIEVVHDLHRRLPDVQIHVVQRGPGFRHVDTCQFSNEWFHPSAVDRFHGLPWPQRRRILDDLGDVNYGVVEPRTADDLYRAMYVERVEGRERVHIHTFTEIDAARRSGDAVAMRLRSTLDGAVTEVGLDAVVACTGFRHLTPPAYAEEVAPLVKHEEDGMPLVTRDYELVFDCPASARMFVAGDSEETHGVSDASSFSMLAGRAARIARGLALPAAVRQPVPEIVARVAP
jgi:L-ornithine N5-monooxygenase